MEEGANGEGERRGASDIWASATVHQMFSFFPQPLEEKSTESCRLNTIRAARNLRDCHRCSSPRRDVRVTVKSHRKIVLRGKGNIKIQAGEKGGKS